MAPLNTAAWELDLLRGSSGLRCERSSQQYGSCEALRGLALEVTWYRFHCSHKDTPSGKETETHSSVEEASKNLEPCFKLTTLR